MSFRTQNHPVDLMLWIAISFSIILLGLTVANILPMYVLGWYVALSLATYLLYRHDKNAAKNDSWRVAESTLHKLALAGGWVGAACAQKWLRHKSAKAIFRKHFYLTVWGNIVGLVIIYYLKFYSQR